MTLQLPGTQSSLNEPKRGGRSIGHDLNRPPEDGDSQLDKSWLREQLLAGKKSPLCDPITPTYFDQILARARGVF